MSLLILSCFAFKVVGSFGKINCTSEANCKCISTNENNLKADCSSLQLQTFPTFSENVTVIDLRNNSIDKIYSTYILPSGLQWLDISFCKLHEIDTGFLSKFPALEYLDISYNRELTFEVLPNVTYDLQFTLIKTLKFDALYCTHGDGNVLQLRHIYHLHNTSLEEIHASSNRIATVEQQVIASMPQTIVNISIADNRFTFGWFTLEISSAKHIKRVNMSYQYTPYEQYLVFLEDDCNDTRNVPNKQHAEKGINMMYKQGLWNTEKWQNLSSCYIPNIASNKRFTVYLCFPETLEYLNMGHSAMQSHHLNDYVVCDMRSIKTYIANDNLWTSLEYKLFSENLTEVDVSNNLLEYIDPNHFNNANLSSLNLSNNYLGDQISNSSLNFLPKRYRSNLLDLSLSRNRIHRIPETFFDGLAHLRYLDISQNELQEFSFSFQSLTDLQLLKLGQNKIRAMEPKQMESIDDIVSNVRRTHRLIIDLSQNDLSCNCDNRKFLQWMEHHKVGNKIHFENIDSYFCFFPNQSKSYFSDLSTIVMDLDRKCSSYTGIIVGTVVAITTFLVFGVVGLLYRLRWRIRYMFYMAKRVYRRNAYARSITNLNYRSIFQYDAFISYATDSSDFGLHDIIREVEDKTDLKLCFHQRDFIPGYDIAENIANAIHESKKVVCVISNSYLASHWCMYEFNMALMERIHAREGEDMLFLVLLKDFNASRAPLSMIEFIRSNSYLEYPDDETYLHVFWSKMVDALSMI